MSGDQFDLDDILERADRAAAFADTDVEYTVSTHDVPALVDEVRRLRAERDAYRTSVAGLRAALGFKQGTIDDLAAVVERLEDANG